MKNLRPAVSSMLKCLRYQTIVSDSWAQAILKASASFHARGKVTGCHRRSSMLAICPSSTSPTCISQLPLKGILSLSTALILCAMTSSKVTNRHFFINTLFDYDLATTDEVDAARQSAERTSITTNHLTAGVVDVGSTTLLVGEQAVDARAHGDEEQTLADA